MLNPTTIVFGVTPPVVPKIRPYSEGSGIAGLQSAPMNKHSASSSERERLGGTGEPGSGSVAGGSEWGEDESSDHAREKRLKPGEVGHEECRVLERLPFFHCLSE